MPVSVFVVFQSNRLFVFLDLLREISRPEMFLGHVILFFGKLECYQNMQKDQKNWKFLFNYFWQKWWDIFVICKCSTGKFPVPNLEPPKIGLSNQWIFWS